MLIFRITNGWCHKIRVIFPSSWNRFLMLRIIELWLLLLIKGLRLVNTFKLLNIIRRSFIKRHQILLLLSLIPLIKLSLILHCVSLKNLSNTLLLELCKLIPIIFIMVGEHGLVVGLFFVVVYSDFCNCPTRLTITRIIFHFLISIELLLVVCRLKSRQLVRVYFMGHENQLVVDFLCNSL